MFATGTNNWWRGLGAQRLRPGRAQRAHPAGDDERARRHGRAADDARRAASSSTLPGAPAVIQTTPANGAGAIDAHERRVVPVRPRARSRPRIDDADITLAEFGGARSRARSRWNPTTRTLTFQPAESLESVRRRTPPRSTTGMKTWKGGHSATQTVQLQHRPGHAAGRDLARSGRRRRRDRERRADHDHFDRRLDPATVTTSTVMRAPHGRRRRRARRASPIRRPGIS